MSVPLPDGVPAAGSPAFSASEEAAGDGQGEYQDDDEEEQQQQDEEEDEDEQDEDDEDDDELDDEEDLMGELDAHLEGDEGEGGGNEQEAAADEADADAEEGAEGQGHDEGGEEQEYEEGAEWEEGANYAAPQPTPAALPSAAAGMGGDGRIGEDEIGDDDADLPEEQAGDAGSQPGEDVAEEGTKRKRNPLLAGLEIDPEMAELMHRRKQAEKELLNQLDAVQTEKFTLFKRAKFVPSKVKKVLDTVAGRSIPEKPLCIAMAAVAKVFVGEIVEDARSIATRGGHHGPLLPSHVYEAYHAAQEVQPGVRKAARLFR